MPLYNPADSRPAHIQIADDLREQINSGYLPVGQRLPTQETLSTTWGVARDTVQAALRVLRHEGRITSRQGRGTFVRTPPPRVRRDSSWKQEEKDLALEDLETRRKTGTAETAMGVSIHDTAHQSHFTTIEADSRLAELFELKNDLRVLQREYISTSKETGLRLSWSRSWLPVWRIEGDPKILDPNEEPWPGGTPHALSTVGIEVDSHVDVINLHPVSAEDQHIWGLEDGVGMFHTSGYIYDTTGSIIVVSESLDPGDRTEFVFRTKLERW